MSDLLGFNLEELRTSLGLAGEKTSSPATPSSVELPESTINFEDTNSLLGFDMNLSPEQESEKIDTTNFLGFNLEDLQKQMGPVVESPTETLLPFTFAPEPTADAAVELDTYLQDINNARIDEEAIKNINTNKNQLNVFRTADNMTFGIKESMFLAQNDVSKRANLPEQLQPVWDVAFQLAGGNSRKLVATDTGIQDVADVIFEGLKTPKEIQKGKRTYWWRILNQKDTRENFLAQIPDNGRNVEMLQNIFNKFDEIKAKDGVTNADFNEFLYSAFLQLSSNVPSIMAMGGTVMSGVATMGLSIVIALGISAVVNNTLQSAETAATDVLSRYLNGDITKEQYLGTMNTLIKPEFLDPKTGKPLNDKITGAIEAAKQGVPTSYGLTTQELESTYKYSGPMFSRYFQSVLSGEKLAAPEFGIVYNKSSMSGDMSAEILTSLAAMLVTRQVAPGASIVNLLNVGVSNFAKNMTGNVIIGKSLETAMSNDGVRAFVSDTPTLLRPFLMQALNIVPSVAAKFGYSNFMGPVFEEYGKMFEDSKMYAVSKFFQDMGNNLKTDNVFFSLPEAARSIPIDFTKFQLKPENEISIDSKILKQFRVEDLEDTRTNGLDFTPATNEEIISTLNPSKTNYNLTLNKDGTGNLQVVLDASNTRMQTFGNDIIRLSIPQYTDLIRSMFISNKEIVGFTSKLDTLHSDLTSSKQFPKILKKLELTKAEIESLQVNSKLSDILSLVPREYNDELRSSHALSSTIRDNHAAVIGNNIVTQWLASLTEKIKPNMVPPQLRLNNALSILDGMLNGWLLDSNAILAKQLSKKEGTSKVRGFVQSILGGTLNVLKDIKVREQFKLTDSLLEKLTAIKDSIRTNPEDTIKLTNEFVATLRANLSPDVRKFLNVDKALGEDLLTYILLKSNTKPANMSISDVHFVLKGNKTGSVEPLSIVDLRHLVTDIINGGTASIYNKIKESGMNSDLFTSLKNTFGTSDMDVINGNIKRVTAFANKFSSKTALDVSNAVKNNIQAIFKLSDTSKAIKDYAALKNAVGFSNESQRTLQISASSENAIRNGKKAALLDKFTLLLTPILDAGLIKTINNKINIFYELTSSNHLDSLATLIKGKANPILKYLSLNKKDEGLLFAMYGLDSANIAKFRSLMSEGKTTTSLFKKELLKTTSELRGSKMKDIPRILKILETASEKATDADTSMLAKSDMARKEIIEDALDIIGDADIVKYKKGILAADTYTLTEELTKVFKNVLGTILKESGVDPETSPLYKHANLYQMVELFKMKESFGKLSSTIRAQLKELAKNARNSSDIRNNVHTKTILSIARDLGIDVDESKLSSFLKVNSIIRFGDKVSDRAALALITDGFNRVGLNLDKSKSGMDATLRTLQNHYVSLDGTRLIGQLSVASGLKSQIEIKLAQLSKATFTSSRLPLIAEIRNLLEDYKEAVNSLTTNTDIRKFGENSANIMKTSFDWSVTNLTKNITELLDMAKDNPKFPTDSGVFNKYVRSMTSVFDLSSKMANAFFDNLGKNTQYKNFNYTASDIEAAVYSTMQAMSKLSLYTVKRGLTEMQSILPSKGITPDLINFAKRQYYTLLTKESFANMFRYTVDPFFGFSDEFKEIQRIIKLDNETLMSDLKLAWGKMFDPIRIKDTTTQMTNFVKFIADNYGKKEAEDLLYKALYWKFAPDYIDMENIDQAVLTEKAGEYMKLFKAANDTGLLAPYIEQAMKFFASGDNYNVTLNEQQSLDLRFRTALQTYAKKNGLSYEDFEAKLKATGQNVGDLVDVTGLLAKDVIGDILFGAITDDTVMSALTKHAPIIAESAQDLRRVSKQVSYYALKENEVGIADIERNPNAGLRKLYLNAQESNANSFIKNPINALKILTDTRYYMKLWTKELLHKVTSDILDTDLLERSVYDNKELDAVTVLSLPSKTNLLEKGGKEEDFGRIVLHLKDEIALKRFALFGEGREKNDRGLVDHVVQIATNKKAEDANDIIATFNPKNGTLTLKNVNLLVSRSDSNDKLPKAGVIIRTAHDKNKSNKTLKGIKSSFKESEFGVITEKELKGKKVIEITEDELHGLLVESKKAYGDLTTEEAIKAAKVTNQGGVFGHATEEKFVQAIQAAIKESKDLKGITVKLGNNLTIPNVVKAGGMSALKSAVSRIAEGNLDPDQQWVRGIAQGKSLKPDTWLLSMKNGKYHFTFFSLKTGDAGYYDATSSVLKNLPILRAFVDLAAHRLNKLLENLDSMDEETRQSYIEMVNHEKSSAYVDLVKSLEASFKSAPFIIKIVNAYLAETDPAFNKNPFKTSYFNEIANRFIQSISKDNKELYEAILAYRKDSSSGELAEGDSEKLVENIVNSLYESMPWFKQFEDLIEKNHDTFVQMVPDMMNWMYSDAAGGKTGSEALFTKRLMNIANGISREQGTKDDDRPLLEAQNLRAFSILGDIRKLDPSYLVFAQMVSNPFTVLNKSIGELMTKVKAKKFIANVLDKSGMISILPSNAEELKYYTSNPEYTVMTADALKRATNNDIFGNTLADYIRYSPAFLQEAERTILKESSESLAGKKVSHTEMQAFVNAVNNEKALFGKTKIAIHNNLLSELKGLYEEVDKKNMLHRFLSNLMADYRYEYNGAVLTLNHVGWLRNFMGAVVLPMYALGPVDGLYYAMRAMVIMRGYGGDAGASELANFRVQNRTVPMANARFSAEPFANMHSIKQEETSKQYKLASMALVKPIQITNKIGFKLTQAALNTSLMKNAMRSFGVDTSDPFTMMAGLRNLYGAVDEISKFAVFLAAREGKVKAPTASTWINKKFTQAGDEALSAFNNIYGANQFRKDIGNGTLGKMSNEDAFKFARQFSFTYEQLPKFFQGLRTYYNPFISFVYNSGRILGNAMAMYPFRTIATYVALKEMNAILEHQYGISINFNTVIPGMDMMDAMSAGTFPDSMNPVNPTAPLSKLIYMVWNNRDPYTKQELPESGLLGRIARGYSNSIFTVSPTLNFALRSMNHALPYDSSYVEQSKVASYLESLLPKSYMYTKAVEQGMLGKPIDRFGTKIRPWVGAMYALGGLNISVTDQIKLQRQSNLFATALKREVTHYNKLLQSDPYRTNKDINMELQKSDAKIKRLKQQFGETMYTLYGVTPYVAKDEYNPILDGNIIENVLNHTVNDILSTWMPTLFGRSVPYSSSGRAY